MTMEPKVLENGALHFLSKGLKGVCSARKKVIHPSKSWHGKAKCRYASSVEMRSKPDKLDLTLRVMYEVEYFTGGWLAFCSGRSYLAQENSFWC